MFDVVISRDCHFNGEEGLQNCWGRPENTKRYNIDDGITVNGSLRDGMFTTALALSMMASRGERVSHTYKEVIDGEEVTIRVMKPAESTATENKMGAFSLSDYTGFLIEEEQDE